MKRVLLLLGVALGGCTSVPGVRGPASDDAFPDKIIDAHAHFFDEDAEPVPSPKDLEEFQKNHVVAAVVHLADSKPIKIDRSKMKFAICAGIGENSTVREVEQGIRNGDFQCIKIYLGYVHKYAYDPFYFQFYKIAERQHVPVVLHTGDPNDEKGLIKYTDPMTVDEIAVKFPKVRFVIAHMGNPWIHSAAEVVYKNANVYADLSALMLGDLHQNDPDRVEELVVKPIRWFYLYTDHKKMMFGTDWPLSKTAGYIAAIKKALPPETWKDVFYENAATLFKLR